MSKRAVGIIIAGFLTIFIAFAVRYAYGLLLPHMLPSLGTTKAGAGTVYSSYFISYTLFSLFLGFLVDRYDARVLLTIFVLVLAVGIYLMSRSASLFQASIFFTLAGIGQSACWVPVVTVVQRWVQDNRRGTALAIVDLGSGSGIAVMSFLMPIIVAGSSWRTGWMTLGGMALFIGIIDFFLIKSYPPGSEENVVVDPAKTERLSIWKAFMHLTGYREFWLIGFSYLCICFSILIPFTFLTSFATDSLGIPFDKASRLITVIAVSGIFGKLTLAALSDTIGRIKSMMACGVIVAAGGLGLALSGNYLQLSLTSALFGYGYGALWVIYAAASRDFFPVSYAGSVVGLWTVFLGIGSILAPIVTGWTIDQSGGYVWAFLLVLFSGIASLAFLFPVARLKR